MKKKYYKVLDIEEKRNEFGEIIFDPMYRLPGSVYEYQYEKDGIGYFTDGVYMLIPIRMEDVIEIDESEVGFVEYSLKDLIKKIY